MSRRFALIVLVAFGCVVLWSPRPALASVNKPSQVTLNAFVTAYPVSAGYSHYWVHYYSATNHYENVDMIAVPGYGHATTMHCVGSGISSMYPWSIGVWRTGAGTVRVGFWSGGSSSLGSANPAWTGGYDTYHEADHFLGWGSDWSLWGLTYTESAIMVQPTDESLVIEKGDVVFQVWCGTRHHYNLVINGVLMGSLDQVVPEGGGIVVDDLDFTWRWYNGVSLQLTDGSGEDEGVWFDWSFYYESDLVSADLYYPVPGYLAKGTYVVQGVGRGDLAHVVVRDPLGATVECDVVDDAFSGEVPFLVSGTYTLETTDEEVLWIGYYSVTSQGMVIPPAPGGEPDTTSGLAQLAAYLADAKGVMEMAFGLLPSFIRSLALIGLGVAVFLRFLGR